MQAPGTSHRDPTAPLPPEWDTIARYLAGECPAEQADAVLRWLQTHPADADLVRALDGTLDHLALRPAMELDVESALRRVTARRAAGEIGKAGETDARVLPLRPRRESSVVRAWRAPALRAAAVLAVVAGGALAWRALHRGAADTPERSYATAAGQRDSVRLPDGSTALLGPSSRLVVGAGYGRPARDVALEGEATFDVRHDDAHPFTVRAGDATIRDVGTTFTVRADGAAQGSPVRVAVSSGAVLLDVAGASAEAGRGVVLHQGDVGVLRADGRAVARSGCATGSDGSWTQGRLVFREAGLDEVRGALRCWYGLELRVADSAIAARHLTATFDGESTDGVLRVLGLALGAQIDRRGDTVLVRTR